MIHTIVCSCVITLTYASFFLFAIFDPVWVILDIKWLVSASIVLLLFILTKGSRERLLALSIGLCHGDILYTAVLYYLHPNKIIGDYFFLDILAIALLVYSVWMLLISFVARLHTQYKRQQPKKTSF